LTDPFGYGTCSVCGGYYRLVGDLCEECDPNKPSEDAVRIDYSKSKPPIWPNQPGGGTQLYYNGNPILATKSDGSIEILGNPKYVWWMDDNLDAYYAVCSYTSYSMEALKKAIARLVAAGWQLEHYHGPLTAILIRPEFPLYRDE